MTKELVLGRVQGLSSYELAIQTGAFSGTLAEYLNKEQEYYNKMVKYGESIKEDIQTIKSEIDSIKNRLTALESTKSD